MWWSMWRQRSLRFTRPNLIEFKNSRDILIFNVIFQNSPFWNIHPVYCRFFLCSFSPLLTSYHLCLSKTKPSCCRNVVIKHVTVLAPRDSPNTDGIDPGIYSTCLFLFLALNSIVYSSLASICKLTIKHRSDSSSNICIEDAFISTGDDLVAVKSGWDEYGIAYGRPSSGITIRRITGSSPFSGIAIGSETSGGIDNILVENVNLYNTGIGIHIKTNIGRGGHIRNVTVANVRMRRVRKGIRIAGDVGDHPDKYFNRRAIPTVDDVTIKNVWGMQVQQPGSMEGIRSAPFTRICLSNVKLWGVGPRRAGWRCSAVRGAAVDVRPWPCSELAHTSSSGFCSSKVRDRNSNRN